jgi:hypothetical protein
LISSDVSKGMCVYVCICAYVYVDLCMCICDYFGNYLFILFFMSSLSLFFFLSTFMQS